uniref:Uncharacterized protein n=1 Tax=Timema bartmani TaxID=61472 RepID=A0A7R9FFJ6_9NEOP|nr:unnamed protein product [Timema bartmani]
MRFNKETVPGTCDSFSHFTLFPHEYWFKERNRCTQFTLYNAATGQR